MINNDIKIFFSAIEEHDSSVVKDMLAAGMSPNVTFKNTAALMSATVAGDLFSIKALLDAGADPNHRENSGATNGLATALNLACLSGQRSAVELLLDYGADPAAVSNDRRTPGHYLLQQLPERWTPLWHKFVERTLTHMFEKGLSVDAGDAAGNTLLHTAFAHGQPSDVIKFLLASGASPNIPNAPGRTPLHFAVTNSRPADVRLLIDAGADINVADNSGQTALFFYNDRETGEVIFGYKPDLNHKDKTGRTALHSRLVCCNRDEECGFTKALLMAGADPNIRARNGETASDIAKRRGLTLCEPMISAAKARTAIKAVTASPGAMPRPK